MSKKVGIITIHSVYNYGAMLQAYALEVYLSNQGYDAEIIDYRPYFICRHYQFFWHDLILNPRASITLIKQILLKRKKFSNFREFFTKNMRVSNRAYYNGKDLELCGYDVLITGSDQIWNEHITGGDENFLLKFANKVQIRIAYSSSFGVSNISDEWASKVSQGLVDFYRIGVREEEGQNIINEFDSDIVSEVVLDPVFLLSRDNWVSLSEDQLTPDYQYILVYSLEISDELRGYIDKLREITEFQVVSIHPFEEDNDYSDLCVSNAGPKQFISLINNANYIVTNSFHGMAFSILLNKEFIAVPHTKTGSRMTSLLSRCGFKEIALDSNLLPMRKMEKENIEALDYQISKSKDILSIREL